MSPWQNWQSQSLTIHLTGECIMPECPLFPSLISLKLFDFGMSSIHYSILSILYSLASCHQWLGVKRYIDISVHHDILCTIWYIATNMKNIDTKRYDFAVKDMHTTWRVSREVVNATLASLGQHTCHMAEQHSWISVIFTIFQRKCCNSLCKTSSLGIVGT